MQLHQPSFKNRLGKSLAKPLSYVACSGLVYRPLRMVDAYLNFLIGKGSGTGWNIKEEVAAAIPCIRRPNPVVFDVGANVGCWSEGLLQAIPSARVFMFDPSPGCHAAIQDKALPGVKLFQCALGDVAGQMTYYSSSPTDGTASLHVRRDTPFETFRYTQSTVAVRTLDEIIDTEKIDFVDFMKMDIEGHELFALKGAQRALTAGKIGALSFEFGCGNINSRTFFCDFWELLTKANYDLYRICPHGKGLSETHYYEDLEYFRGATNYIAQLKRPSAQKS